MLGRSRIFHPCILQWPPIFNSRIFSRPASNLYFHNVSVYCNVLVEGLNAAANWQIDEWRMAWHADAWLSVGKCLMLCVGRKPTRVYWTLRPIPIRLNTHVVGSITQSSVCYTNVLAVVFSITRSKPADFSNFRCTKSGKISHQNITNFFTSLIDYSRCRAYLEKFSH